MKTQVDCFTPDSDALVPRRSGFPVNSFHADDLQLLLDIVRNVSREESGISRIEIVIERGHREGSVPTRKADAEMTDGREYHPSAGRRSPK